MSTTEITASFAALEIEWWGSRTGREVALMVACATGGEGMHIYTPDMLDCEPGDCEASLYLSIRTDDMHRSVAAVRAAGLRVKTGWTVPESVAQGTLDDLWK